MGKTQSSGNCRGLRIESGGVLTVCWRKVSVFCPETSVRAQSIIDKGCCFHLSACTAPGMWGHQTQFHCAVGLWCCTALERRHSYTCPLGLRESSALTGNLQNCDSMSQFCWNFTEKPQTNVSYLAISTGRFKMKTKVVLSVCSTVKYKF